MSEQAQKSEVHETTADAEDDRAQESTKPSDAAADPDHDARERLAKREMTERRSDPDDSSYGGVLDLDRSDVT